MILINQQMELKMTLNKEQLDYLIGETQAERIRLERARRDAKRILNGTHGDKELRYRWMWAKGEMFKIDKELNFLNDLYDNLRNQDQELSYKTIQGGK